LLPSAKVTGKLAISLIDAARVFEVLVAVVAVRKYLATALTLKPIATCNNQYKPAYMHTYSCPTEITGCH